MAADQSGQSVLEFLLLLPMLVGMVILTMRVNMAIQVSINDQQYARAQALFLTFNSAQYPEITDKLGAPRRITGVNQMVLGVADNAQADGEATYKPSATEVDVARNPAQAGEEGEPQDEPTTRGYVRVRDTVTLCTQTNMIQTAEGLVPLGNQSLAEETAPAAFDYCRGTQ